MPAYTLGIDYGTSAVRALIADIATGEEIAVGSVPYPHGTITDPSDPNLARQHPADYEPAFIETVRAALDQARDHPGFDPARIVGLGTDATGSTPLPVDASADPLALHPEFAGDPDALAWLWKDHTSHAEAAEITGRCAPHLGPCGGTYSSEWFWSKALRGARTNPRVAEHAEAWVELSDYIPAMLAGIDAPSAIPRNACAAGHKGLYHQAWGGLLSRDLLADLHPALARFHDSFNAPALTADSRAGTLAPRLAHATGLPDNLPIACGILDAHAGAIGSGVGPGTLVKILGTSTCDCLVADGPATAEGIPGISGVVPDSIIPGLLGIESGQSAVGDIFDWCVNRLCQGLSHETLAEQADAIPPGASGLLALDWHNGNRNVLADPLLTGAVLGLTLHTTPAEIYRALIEATAFGARAILDRLAEHNVAIDRIVNCGGIADKSPLLMQIYADVCNRPMHIARSGEACALGAAICGAVAGGAHADIPAAQRAMTGVKPTAYHPRSSNASTYDDLYALYTDLHDTFGAVGQPDLGATMKRLIQIRDRARSS